MASMNPLKALIVDDERLARADLKSLLSRHAEIEVVGEADDVSSAARRVEEVKPDVIFLDIQMPGESGFDLLERIETDARVIFVTAHDEFAIRAFEVNALDYLLKPIHPDRLAKALDRLMSGEMPTPAKDRKLACDDRLFLMVGNRFKFLRIGTIISITAAGDYSEVLTADKKKGLTLKTLGEWEARLPEQSFARIHRSAIVNLEAVERVEEWFNYSFRVYLTGVEEPFIMSRRQATKLKGRMG